MDASSLKPTLKGKFHFLQPGPYFWHFLWSYTHPEKFGVIWSPSEDIRSFVRAAYPYNESEWGHSGAQTKCV